MHICPLCLQDVASVWARVPTRALSELHAAALGFEHLYSAAELLVVRCPHCELISFHGEPEADGGYYERLRRFEWYYPSDKPEFGFVCSQLSRPCRILEVGAGVGHFAAWLPGHVYVGLETNPSAAEQARRLGRPVLSETLGQHLARGGPAYDWVVSFQVLEHVQNIHAFIGECMQALAPGGRLALSVPNDEGFVGLQRNNVLNFPPHHLSRWSAASLRSIEGLFPLTLEVLDFEVMRDEHVLPCAKSKVLNALHPVDDVSRFQPAPAWARAPLGSFVSAMARGVAWGLNRSADRPQGHSVTAVFRRHDPPR